MENNRGKETGGENCLYRVAAGGDLRLPPRNAGERKQSGSRGKPSSIRSVSLAISGDEFTNQFGVKIPVLLLFG